MKYISSLAINEVINGLLLSDGTIEKPHKGGNARFRLPQKVKNSDLCQIVFELLNDLDFKPKLKYYSSICKLPDGKQYEQTRCLVYTESRNYFTIIHSKWYENNKKVIPRDLKLTPITLAYWYMGDGSQQGRNRAIFATDNFSLIDQLLLIKELKLLGIKSTLNHIKPERKFNKPCYRLLISAENGDRFFSLIEPYITNSFRYKLCKQIGELKIA